MYRSGEPSSVTSPTCAGDTGLGLFIPATSKSQPASLGIGVPEKRASLAMDLLAIVNAKRMMECVTFRMDNTMFASEYIAERPRKPRLDTAYGFCFRNCATHCLTEAERRLGDHRKYNQTKIHFVLESGHKHAGDAVRIFDEMKDALAKEGNNVMGAVTFASKGECAPLLMADFFAHTAWWMDQVKRSSAIPEVRLFGSSTRGASNLTHITYRPGGMANVRNELLRMARDRKRKRLFSENPSVSHLHQKSE